MSGLALSAETFTYWMLKQFAVSQLVLLSLIPNRLFVHVHVDVSQISYLEDAPRDLELSQTEK